MIRFIMADNKRNLTNKKILDKYSRIRLLYPRSSQFLHPNCLERNFPTDFPLKKLWLKNPASALINSVFITIVGNVLLKRAINCSCESLKNNSSIVFKTNRIWNRNHESSKLFR